ncbi:MAG: glycosyltransferase [Cytophagales bacterium]|nr:glycosyltransferase [Cytophagales bacterium]
MNIVFFSHPNFFNSQSMPRYTQMLSEGMNMLGHSVEIWSPKGRMVNLSKGKWKKWFGYIDQFMIFPLEVKWKIKKLPKDTLFVITDHALGPWVPLIKKSRHVIHCHDFLAQESAKENIPEHKTGTTGKLYQRFIYKGYSQGKNFISVSQKTQKDLHRFLGYEPKISEVVYNGINKPLKFKNGYDSRKVVGNYIGKDVSNGYILHVGGNSWYKNRIGVVKIYDYWRNKYSSPLPLVLVGQSPSGDLLTAKSLSKFSEDIHFLTHMDDTYINDAYSGATVLLFPSMEEGFGWPIAEAMASGCPVITTGKDPMMEVAGKAGIFIDRFEIGKHNYQKWLENSSAVLEGVIQMPEKERTKLVESGLENAKRFDTNQSILSIESIYKRVLES